jgi:hypothetical protein
MGWFTSHTCSEAIYVIVTLTLCWHKKTIHSSMKLSHSHLSVHQVNDIRMEEAENMKGECNVSQIMPYHQHRRTFDVVK